MSTRGFQLSREEEELLEPILATLSSVAGFNISIASLLERWQQFVKAVEEIYDDSIYEYTNDLSVRDLLEKVINACPSTVRIRLTNALSPTDRRFLTVTRPMSVPLMHRSGNSLGWWWFRMPLRLGPELQNDLQEMLRDD